LALTLPASGGRSVGIVRSRTKATEFGGWLVGKEMYKIICAHILVFKFVIKEIEMYNNVKYN
jgi:hypothetical protein